MKGAGLQRARPATGAAPLIDRSQSKSLPGLACLGAGLLCPEEAGLQWDLKQETSLRAGAREPREPRPAWTPTVGEAEPVVRLRPQRLVLQNRVLLAALGPVQVSVLVLPRPEHAPEDVLVQPGLAGLRHAAQQADQSAARPPPAPENSEPGKQNPKVLINSGLGLDLVH